MCQVPKVYILTGVSYKSHESDLKVYIYLVLIRSKHLAAFLGRSAFGRYTPEVSGRLLWNLFQAIEVR